MACESFSEIKEIEINCLYYKNDEHKIISFNCVIFLGLSDPYVKFKTGGRQIYKSKTVYKSLNPTWDETFTYLLDDPFEPVQIKVKNNSYFNERSKLNNTSI